MLSSSAVTQSVRSALVKLGIRIRVTAHSGRKGTAEELVLAGLPMVVVQSFGGCNNLATLERYIGEAIRKNVALGDILSNKVYR